MTVNLLQYNKTVQYDVCYLYKTITHIQVLSAGNNHLNSGAVHTAQNQDAAPPVWFSSDCRCTFTAEPFIHNIILMSTEDVWVMATGTMQRKFDEIWIFDSCLWTVPQTDRHAHHNTLFPYHVQSKTVKALKVWEPHVNAACHNLHIS